MWESEMLTMINLKINKLTNINFLVCIVYKPRMYYANI